MAEQCLHASVESGVMASSCCLGYQHWISCSRLCHRTNSHCCGCHWQLVVLGLLGVSSRKSCLAMEGQDRLPVISLVGSGGVGKRSIAARLRQAGDGAEQDIWQIDTRYYTADVLLCCTDTASAAPQNEPEALVLVCTADSRDTFLACKGWQEKAGVTCEIQLCVINKRDLLPADEAPHFLPACQLWCQQQGFELVEVGLQWCKLSDSVPAKPWWRASKGVPVQASATDLTVDTRLGQRDEGQGLRRVVSALQAHMWPGMQLKVRGAAEQAPGDAALTLCLFTCGWAVPCTCKARCWPL